MGITPGVNAIDGFAKADTDRLKKAEIAVLQLTKEARQKRRSQKRKCEDKESADTQSYEPADSEQVLGVEWTGESERECRAFLTFLLHLSSVRLSIRLSFPLLPLSRIFNYTDRFNRK
ncbi:hypothetical protein J6590_002442 [Homalodisca vitripennis]|nr:hypothetical protein J6590_002442 [Homalodisca vitripennis]